jgi:ribosome maturation factor RimP
MSDSLEQEIEARVEQLGFELVELERAGSKSRPILRVRIDRPDSTPGHGVSVEDCQLVSRTLEAQLEERRAVPERYVLEVSSPGVERALVRDRDFERFRGQEIAVHGKTGLQDGNKRIDGELLGLSEDGGTGYIRIKTKDGSELAIPRDQVKRVHLVYRWGGNPKS